MSEKALDATDFPAIDIDSPSLKEILWHKMREDLSRYIPRILDTEKLMCPACCRFLPFADFDIEHIIPEQSLADDPPEVRAAIPKIERGGVTLLCKKQLLINGKKIYANGCNSWKGRFYDRFLKETFNAKVVIGGTYTSRHQVALFVIGYLGLFARYGYHITLSESGVTMRRQFFSPNKFNKDVPLKCQMTLTGAPDLRYNEQTEKYWKPPFKVSIDRNFFCVVVRNSSIFLPMSRNPEVIVSRKLPFVPQKYAFRPDFVTVFH